MCSHLLLWRVPGNPGSFRFLLQQTLFSCYAFSYKLFVLWVIRLHVCVPWVSGVPRGQKRALEPLKLKLEMVVTHPVVRFSAGTASACSEPWATSVPPLVRVFSEVVFCWQRIGLFPLHFHSKYAHKNVQWNTGKEMLAGSHLEV